MKLINKVNIYYLIAIGFILLSSCQTWQLNKSFNRHYKRLKKINGDTLIAPDTDYGRKLPDYFVDYVVEKEKIRGFGMWKYVTRREDLIPLPPSRMVIDKHIVSIYDYKRRIPKGYRSRSSSNPQEGTMLSLVIDITKNDSLNTVGRIEVSDAEGNRASVPYPSVRRLEHPNFSGNCIGIQPPQAFYSKNMQYLYIYIYGGEDGYEKCQELYEVSPLYIVKFVFELKPVPKYVGRIYVKGWVADSYGYSRIHYGYLGF